MDAKKIKKLLIDQNLTVAELARRAGYSRVHVSEVIHGHRKSLEAQRRIWAALKAARDRAA
jgi:transcriptional regulator with XRE-family HTH domain